MNVSEQARTTYRDVIARIDDSRHVGAHGLADVHPVHARHQDVQHHQRGALFADAMGPAGTPEASYLGMMRHNARTIVRALGGDASAIDREAP